MKEKIEEILQAKTKLTETCEKFEASLKFFCFMVMPCLDYGKDNWYIFWKEDGREDKPQEEICELDDMKKYMKSDDFGDFTQEQKEEYIKVLTFYLQSDAYDKWDS